MEQPVKIFRLTEEDALKIMESPDEPHQHDYEELIVGISGKLIHFIDFRSTTIEAPFVSFVTKGKIHRAIPELLNGSCQMWVIRFQSSFIAGNTFQLYARYHDAANINLKADEAFRRMQILCEIMSAELMQQTPDFGVLRHLLSALFGMIETARKNQAEYGSANTSHNTTFQNFLAILEANFQRTEGVQFYAEKLFMSPRNLNLICRQVLNKSVSEIIEARKLTEAGNLLASTDKPISEIGYELGYQEKSYFTSVFKKKTGQTPGEFREKMRQLSA